MIPTRPTTGRGTRIRNINDELGAEKIDIIEWSDSLEELVQNALKPAKNIPIEYIFPDEETKSIFVLVDEEQKPLAIGMGGRNVRLAARIVGWEIEIKTPAEYEAELLAAERSEAAAPAAETGEPGEPAASEEETATATETAPESAEKEPETPAEPVAEVETQPAPEGTVPGRSEG